jgi:hypothetical protein
MKRALLLLFLLSSFSCAAADVTDFQRAKQRYEEKKFEATRLNDELLGADQKSVKQVLGTPVEKRKESFPYLADSNCTGSKCEKKWADEIWFYEFMYKDKSGKHIYSINVYFVNGRVVQIY